ncbi:type II toxin-antitoxin system VapC family toxin [Methylococcus sp. ANG]|uniref:type II toxin-antitoxin system VapC family toxin n=1 Tax=Methylococcus sp. ANG TaxID=3231903 RepID=UPI00345751DC
MILVDTNVVSELMKAKPDAIVLGWLDGQSRSDLFTSAITQAEIELGIALLPDGKRRAALASAADAMFAEDFAGAVLPFDAGAARHYAMLVAHRTRVGRPITVEDAQIAAIALRHGLTLATRNLRDFQEIAELALIDPWQPDMP